MGWTLLAAIVFTPAQCNRTVVRKRMQAGRCVPVHAGRRAAAVGTLDLDFAATMPQTACRAN